ncbi:tRNA-intron lyase [Sulfodiicoccus acidiphilus]|uniref:tRNA-splicing endonuclease n=1 Tax=Sulfodiicoccus acidiphilus TaxID=1670455 RepID=A0A348B0T9_9CREN|nr:tRNA-intron lyase [Sulfodiicoccus acidiphilus]BBD71791.1 tRNA-intron lyase [Sulfodiicoccus acidiphilus]GGT99220.1 tRNA-intron lyase [Sulfodiicoccus acidiphilus]
MPCTGNLLGERVVVFDIDEAKQLYNKGYFGKPLGESKPREIKSPLELSLIESVYLMKKGELKVVRNRTPLSVEELIDLASTKVSRFNVLNFVYENLRDKGFIVRSGIKFGADYAIYTIGPGVEHAPYLVVALDAASQISVNELMGFGRVSHSVKKRLILALVDEKAKWVRYITFKWERM